MIDPANITDFELTDEGLEEHLLFWLLVAGKTARVIAQRLDLMLDELDGHPPGSPLDAFRRYRRSLPQYLKRHGVGCFTLKAKGIRHLGRAGLDLRTCELADLVAVPGVGPKTARCFLVHSRPDARYACLDTHVLKFLRDDLGAPDVPATTPQSRSQYERLERVFLAEADRQGKPVAVLDLEVWRRYTRAA